MSQRSRAVAVLEDLLSRAPNNFVESVEAVAEAAKVGVSAQNVGLARVSLGWRSWRKPHGYGFRWGPGGPADTLSGVDVVALRKHLLDLGPGSLATQSFLFDDDPEFGKLVEAAVNEHYAAADPDGNGRRARLLVAGKEKAKAGVDELNALYQELYGEVNEGDVAG